MARILILSQYWAPENGVPQRRWTWLSQILTEQGHEVDVIAPPPHYLRKVGWRQWFEEGGLFGLRTIEKGEAGERIVRSGFFPSGSSLTSRALNQASVAVSMSFLVLLGARRSGLRRPDLVIGTVPALPTAVVTSIAARKFGSPYVIDLRDAWPELLHENSDWNSATGQRSVRERILRKGPLQLILKVTEIFLNRVLSNADGIMTTSKYLEEFLVSASVSGQKTRKLTTIRNVFPVQSTYRTSRGGGEHRELRVLYAGTIGRAQKLENALQAAKIVQDSGYDIQLRFIGEGAAWNSLKTAAKALGVKAEVLHRLPAEELNDSYAWADTALVHLANWEPLEKTVPSKTYELMEVGMHITACVAGETADLVRRLNAGCVVEPENPQALAQAWLELSEDRSLLAIDCSGKDWVATQRDQIAPESFLQMVKELIERSAR